MTNLSQTSNSKLLIHQENLFKKILTKLKSDIEDKV